MSTPGVRSPYFVSPGVDLVVLGGLSIATYAVLRFVPGAAGSSVIPAISPMLVWVVSYPHFAASNHRLYASRSTRRQFPLSAALTPMVFAAAVVASFASPGRVAPAFVKLYQIWSPYHFSGQTVGLTLLYARRSGITVGRALRGALAAFVYLTFVFGAARAEVGVRTGRFYGVRYPSLNLPSWLPHVLALLLGASAVAVLAVLVARRRDGQAALPVVVLVPALTQCVWFVATPIPVYVNLTFFFHSLQYLFVAWNLQLGQSVEHSRGPSHAFVAIESSRWMAFNVGGAAVLFWLLPKAGARFGPSPAFATAVILVAIQTHHFFVDGVIWKLRSPQLGAALQSSLADFTGRARQDGLQPSVPA